MNIILSFGKYKGRDLYTVPEPYLKSLLKLFSENPAPSSPVVNLSIADIRRELERRQRERNEKNKY